jgi:hypothetical protein
MKPSRVLQNEAFAESRRVSESVAQIFFWFIVSVILAATGMFALSMLLKKCGSSNQEGSGSGCQPYLPAAIEGVMCGFSSLQPCWDAMRPS